MLFPFKMLSPSELGTVHEYFVCFSSQFHFKTSLKLPAYVTFQWGFTTRKVAKTKLAKVIVTFLTPSLLFKSPFPLLLLLLLYMCSHVSLSW